MIPKNFIIKWRESAPWKTDNMVEQDLIIEKALVELYKKPLIRENLAFKGGTALNKLFIKPQARYSEDIDLTLIKKIAIGETINQIRDILDPWLGKPSYKHSKFSFKMFYTYESVLGDKMKLKIEINLTTYDNIFGIRYKDFEHNSTYFSGKSKITTFDLDELMGTKLKALYQRNKGRDLFDIWLVLSRNLVDIDRVVQSFNFYSKIEGNPVSRAQFEANLYAKKNNKEFRVDMSKLLAYEVDWNIDEAFSLIETSIYHRLKGTPWKGMKRDT